MMRKQYQQYMFIFCFPACKKPMHCVCHSENNCQELKKETEDKIQTLVTDHKTKVMQNP